MKIDKPTRGRTLRQPLTPGAKRRTGSKLAVKVDLSLSVPERMMATTQRLIAKNGPENITVRDICDASRANVNAVYYYFGSKEALIKSALLILMEPVNVGRSTLLREAEQRHGESVIPLPTILEAFLRPVLSGAQTPDGGRIYVRVEQHLRSVPDSEYSRYVSDHLDHYAKIFLDALHRTIPHLTRGEIVWRYEYLRGAMLHLLGNCDPLSTKFQILAGEHPMIDHRDHELVLKELIATATLGLTAPSLMQPAGLD